MPVKASSTLQPEFHFPTSAFQAFPVHKYVGVHVSMWVMEGDAVDVVYAVAHMLLSASVCLVMCLSPSLTQVRAGLRDQTLDARMLSHPLAAQLEAGTSQLKDLHSTLRTLEVTKKAEDKAM